MNYKRLLVAIPGLIVWFTTFGMDNGPAKYKRYALMLVLYGTGGLFYKFILKTKKDEALDKEIIANNEARFQTGINKAANLIPDMEVRAANVLQGLLAKADNKSPADKIRELDLLKTQGVISEEEFKNAKAKILGI